jgi:ABC-2 type transport system permease protein
VKAEVRKLLTLPSLRLTVVLTWAGAVLMALLPAAAALGYVQSGFLVLGVLAAASEYQAGGQIRTTLLAMPRRLPLQGVKVAALTVVTLPVAAAAALVVTVLPPWAAGHPALTGPVAGDAARATGYLVLTTLLAAAVGGLVRHAVPAVLVVLSCYFVAGPILRARSGGLAAWLPDSAAWLTGPGRLPGMGLTAAAMWTAAAVMAAALAFHRRDA